MSFPTPPPAQDAALVPPHRPGPSWRSTRRDPRLSALARARGADGHVPAERLAAFWADVAATGAPLRESLGETCLVTFVWRGAGQVGRIAVQANRLFDATTPEHALLERLPGSDVWFAGYQVPASWRGTYQFVTLPDLTVAGSGDPGRRRIALREQLQRSAVADPLNTAAADVVGGRLRIAEATAAPPQPWFEPRPVPRGSVVETRPVGPRGEQRRVRIYRSPGWPAWGEGVGTTSGERLGLMLLFDGETWADREPIWASLDNLFVAGVIPGLQVVTIDGGSRLERTRDLGCDPVFASWLLDSLLPEVCDDRVSDDPGVSIVAGQSLGGLMAMYLGHAAPQRFGNVLSQSGAFWYANRPGEDGSGPDAQWLTTAIAGLEPGYPAPRVHLEVGTMEWLTAPLVRRMRDVLLDRGTAVSYQEYCGGHDTLCWRAGLADGLRRLTEGW